APGTSRITPVPTSPTSSSTHPGNHGEETGYAVRQLRRATRSDHNQEPSAPPAAPSTKASSRNCQPMLSRTPLENDAAVLRVASCNRCCRQAARLGPLHSGISAVANSALTPPTTPPATDAEARWPVCERLAARGPEPSAPS